MSEIDAADSELRAADLADAYALSFRDAHRSWNGQTDCNAARLLLLNYYQSAVAAERKRLCEALQIEMQHSAFDGVLQLDDALRNIADALAQGPNVEAERLP